MGLMLGDEKSLHCTEFFLSLGMMQDFDGERARPILADSAVDIQLTTALRLFQMNHPTVLYVGSLPVDADIDLAVHRICDTVNQHAFLTTNPKFCRWDRGPESRLQP